jgi:hypothetical protein
MSLWIPVAAVLAIALVLVVMHRMLTKSTSDENPTQGSA